MMRNTLFALLAVVLACPLVVASDLNVSARSGDLSSVTVPPGFEVRYEILGKLSDDANEGLAMVVFDLSFDGGDLTPADDPTNQPMAYFATSRGLNNIAGFGGTPIDGDLIQVGGMQNTMKTTAYDVPHPIGPVLDGIATANDPAILASGTIDAPLEPGVYTLQVSNVFANVIREGENGVGFWATEQAGIGLLTDLVINVDEDAIVVTESSPASMLVDARQPWSPDGSEFYGWDVVELTATGDTSALTADDFEILHTGDIAPPTIVSVTANGAAVVVELSRSIEPLEWTTIRHVESGTYARLGYLPGDVDGSLETNVNDVLALVDHLNGANVRPLHQTDIDRNGITDGDDILRLLDLMNGEQTYPMFLGEALP